MAKKLSKKINQSIDCFAQTIKTFSNCKLILDERFRNKIRHSEWDGVHVTHKGKMLLINFPNGEHAPMRKWVKTKGIQVFHGNKRIF